MGLGIRLLFVLILIPFLGFSQYSNEWIKPGQTYYRIPIAKQGVYRLSYADLQTAGVPVASIDPRRIQIFHRGQEQSILVQGQADAILDPGDYLEFFGKGNDGTLDKDLYQPASAQPHTYYNLYSDTTAYFLTWQLTAVAGKRITNFSEVNVTNIPKEISHTEERLLINKNEYATGRREADVVQFTHFDEGEGWTGTGIRQNQSIDYTIDLIQNGVSSAGDPQLEILLVGRDLIPHTTQIYVGPNTSSLRLLDTYNFDGFASARLTYALTWSDIGVDGGLAIRFAVPPAANNRLQLSASYIKVTFPQNFESGGSAEKLFRLNPNPASKSYLELENAATNLRLWDVTEETSITAIGTTMAGTTMKGIVPNTQSSRSLFAFTSTTTPTLKKVSFRTINPDQAEYVIISNKSLMKAALGYSDPVKAYAGYRATEAGGGYDTLVVTMDQLYNQFNYGETSSRAIYEFMRYLVAEGSPLYLFLIGKGRDVSSGYHRITNPASTILKDLVPTAGIPASDMAFSAGLGGTEFEPAVPTGRLTASTPEQVAGYLNKIKEIETGLLQPWHKEGLHLSGGILPIELTVFRNFLDGYASLGEGPYFGGHFSTIAKQEPNPVELINISDQVNEGVNIITFFGHSSASTIDIDIGYVSDPTLGYNNPGKYPAFLINGCNAGNFFSGSTSFGEDWMLTANKGARNFIAHSSFGFTNSLWYYSNLFYTIGFTDSVFVKRGIGDVQKEVARQYMSIAPANMANITQVQQMVLLGDPAVRLFNYSKPDYEINSTSLSLISFEDKPVTAASDSFAVQIVLKNLALATPDSVSISIERILSDGTSRKYDALVTPVANADTVRIKIFKESTGEGGTNQFVVTIDPDNSIDELSEGNNSATLNAFIPSNATLNLFPYNFSIVNQPTTQLTWQSTDMLSAERMFEVEVDTTSLFNSGFLLEQDVSGKVMATVSIELLPSDSVVYFWRTRFKEPQPGESADWSTSSFLYVAGGSEGWAQVRLDQLSTNSFTDLILPTASAPFTFEETQTSLMIETFGSASSLPYTEVSVKIDGAEYNLATQGQPCRNNTINFLSFRKTSAVPYAALPFNFQDPRTCGREPQVINSFLTGELETGLSDDLAALVNAIGVSDSVVLFSIGNPGYSGWSASVKAKLNELGIGTTEIESLQDGEPVIILGRKGAAPGSATFIKSQLTPATEQVIIADETITGRNTTGSMKSVTIGPAQAWQQFVASAAALEAEDQSSFSIYGISLSGADTLIADQIAGAYDLSALSALDFPYLKIEYTTTDEINLTPAQWKNWFVLYETAAEGVLLWRGTQPTLTISEGAEWNTRFGFANISNKTFIDSLQVELEVLTAETQLRDRQFFTILPPAPGDTTFFDVSSSSIGKSGLNDVNVVVNKRVIPEPYYDNNYITLVDYLVVEPDQTPPVLEVTFDGRLLRNGAYVSSNPTIRFTLRDENPYLFKQDTSGVELLLRYPCTNSPCPFERVRLNGPDIKIIPATATSPYQIEFTPELTDGEYVLSAQLEDASGNASGDVPYEVGFQVKSDPNFQFKGVYPNPSNNNFYFSFELTGNALPQEFSLEIFSLQGQRIRKFTQDDARFVIGTNELIWNGLDASGGYLPQGLYTYQIQINTGSLSEVVQGKIALIR